MILRPYAVVQKGEFQSGLELVMSDAGVQEVRPLTGHPEPFVVSPAFVNGHSHLEYRGMQGKIASPGYFEWIQELMVAKKAESDMRVRQECIAAAHENKRTGVGYIIEHSDRPFAATALVSAGIEGFLFQETITFYERENRAQKIAAVRAKAAEQAKVWRKPVYLTPHAHTVDEETLREFGTSREPFSIHVAETDFENQWTRDGSGPLADFARRAGFDVPIRGKSIVQYAAELGLCRPGAQFVHCCAVDQEDIRTMARGNVSVAHCPRSNIRLKCPPSPVREMLDAGIAIGLGLDSPASSGQIDMFEEMRAALKVACDRGQPITPSEVWQMATNRSLLKFGQPSPTDSIGPGYNGRLIKVNVAGASGIEDIIQRGRPANIGWI